MVDISVVGAGTIAREAYLPTLASLSNARLRWIVDADAVRAREVAEEFGVPGHTTEHAGTLEETDAVVIATPPQFHAEIASASLRAGVHVLTEKPLALASEEATELVDYANRHALEYAISRQFREAPACRVLRTLANSGTLGALQSFEVTFGDRTDWAFASDYRVDASQAGGGVLTDKGPHVIDVVLWLFGEDFEVTRYEDDSFGGLEANARVELAYDSGLTGSIEVTGTRDVTNRIEITGERGRLVADPDADWVTHHDTERGERMRVALDGESPPDYLARVGLQAKRFVDAVESGSHHRAYTPASEGIPALALVEACYGSRETVSQPWETVGVDRTERERSEKRVLITGAGGLVGGRLAHRLALNGRPVTALLHTPAGAGAMRLARLPCEIAVGSVTDRDLVAGLVADCDAVVHCAYGPGEMSEVGTRTLLELADEHDVQSFVHLSTAVVHGHGHEGVLEESAPFDPDTEYAEEKLAAERAIEAFIDTGDSVLRPSIIRPMIVYGPYSDWITRGLETLRDGAVLADGGRGTLNGIYVDNLVDAIVLALETPAAAGTVFMAADGDDVTWREFYHDLGAFLETYPEIRANSPREIRLRKNARLVTDSVVPPARAVKRVATSGEVHSTVASELGETPWAEPMLEGLPRPLRDPIVDRLGDGNERVAGDPQLDERNPPPDDAPYPLPSERFIQMHSSTGAVSNARLRSLLGWEPRVSYEEAIELIGQWLAHESMV